MPDQTATLDLTGAATAAVAVDLAAGTATATAHTPPPDRPAAVTLDRWDSLEGAMNLGIGLSLTAVRRAAVAAPVADFTGTPLSGSDPLSVTFTDASTGTPTSWLWERNSGSGWSTFSTSQNPTQSFAVGTWDIRLTATNAGGSHTKTRTGYVVAASAFTPASISGLALWLEASPTYCFSDAAGTVPCAAGDAVYVWKDRSGNARDFTQATSGSRPTLQSDGAGGYYVQFDGSDDYMTYAGVPFAAVPGSVEALVYPATNVVRYPFAALNATEDEGFALLYGGLRAVARQYTALDGSATAQSSTTFAAAAWSHMAAVFASASSRSAYLAGGGKATNTTALTVGAAPTATYLGALGLGTPSYFNGRLRYVVAYNVALTDANVTSLAGYTP